MMPRSFFVVDLAPQAPASKDRFRRWVAAYGYCRLSRSLEISRRNIHLWTQKVNADVPQLWMVKKMIAISTVEPLGVGPLTYEDIFGAVSVKSHAAHPYKSMRTQRQIVTRRPS